MDLAANEQNHLVGMYFGPGSRREDALDGEPWCGRQLILRRGFLNCPYSNVEPWGRTAVSQTPAGFTTVALLPYTPDVQWWRWVEQAAEVRRIPHRVKYITPKRLVRAGPALTDCVCRMLPVVEGPPCSWCGSTVLWVRESATTPMFPSCIVVWRPQPRLVGVFGPRYVTWDYR